ncbi:hypothetical protein LOK49_LG06G03069 [Camellia lanceoleosa]|uniref:Uncharacterized protein n=1 Tax=Camellia lanceoleosa TaxID=1840588 RepID=A0ACC0HC55_9ERIC|nr:hypothetical protein LOK49_LG06G03069 [Camellia lanceoleosa]
MTHRSTTHGKTQVTRIGLLDGVDCEETDCVDRFLDEGSVGLGESFDSDGGADGAEGVEALSWGGWGADGVGDRSGRGGFEARVREEEIKRESILYWLCEHTNIVSTTKPIMFPRFLKWNISTLLARTRGMDLTSVLQFKVISGRLVSQPYENVIIAREEFDGGEDANVDEDREVGGEYNSNGNDGFCSDSGGGNDVNMGDGGNEVVVSIEVVAKQNVRGSGDRS